jgi:CheY-like chemotaxis protein
MVNEPVLIVDDNPMNRKLAKILLEKDGYLVSLASDAEEALDSIRAFRPRLILMDIQLPGVDGFELTRQLKENPSTHDILIVALTSYDQKGDQEKAKAAGCDGYLQKPIDVVSLPSVLAGYLRGGRPNGPGAGHSGERNF